MFDEILEILGVAGMYDLKHTRELLGGHIGTLLGLHYASDLFDLKAFTILVPMILPLELVEENELRMGEGGCKRLWPAFQEFFSPHLSNLSQDILDSKASLPLILHSFFQIRLLSNPSYRSSYGVRNEDSSEEGNDSSGDDDEDSSDGGDGSSSDNDVNE